MTRWSADLLDRFCAHATGAAAARPPLHHEFSGSVELELALDAGDVLPYRFVVRGGSIDRCERRPIPAAWALRGPRPPLTGGEGVPPDAWGVRCGTVVHPFPPGDEAGAPAPPAVPAADLDVVWRLDNSPIGDVVALHRFRDGALVEVSLHRPDAPLPAGDLRVEGRSEWWRRMAWRAGELHLLEAVDPTSLDGRWQTLDLALALHHRMRGAAARSWPPLPAGLLWLAGPGRRTVGTVAGDALARLAAEAAG